jgi:anti-sigma-K factor RskA
VNPQDYENLAPLYALGALDGDDLARFNEELARSESLRILVRDYQEAATALPRALDPVAPSAGLKSRVLAAATGQSAPRPAVATRVFWAAAAVVLFSVIVGTLNEPTYESYVMAGADPIPGARGSVRWNDRDLKFRADSLALLPPGKVYELWHIPAGKGPVPAGTYLPDPYGSVRGEFKLRNPVARGDLFAVTIEQGEQKAPAGPMILTPPKSK